MIMVFLSVPCLFQLPSFSIQLPKDQCTESFEKSILRLLNQGDHSESRDVEKNLRYLTFSLDIDLSCQLMGLLQD